jgi:hypothetical protein
MTAIAGAATRFAKDIGTWTSADGTQSIRAHEMTVLHDDGLYRHLRFRSPDSGFYWFDLITWPGNLTINGDAGTYTFARVTDMFEFFRGERGINPGYWAEKVPSETRTKVYSEDKFRQHVFEYAADAIRQGNAPKGLALAVRRQILENEEIYYEDGARQALDAFEHGACGWRFVDTWEWDLSDYEWSFLWCCHAIQWGIAQYDARNSALSAQAATS